MRKVVGLEKAGYIHKGDLYGHTEHIKLNEKLGLEIEVIIMGEPLLIKVYDFENNKISLEKFVEDIIEKDFSFGNDLLFHYEFIKSINKVYIYSIKKGVEVEKVICGAKSVLVAPIQFKIKEFINSKLKKCKNFISITKLRNIYYLINVENNFIINETVNEDIDNILKEIFKHTKFNKEIIFDTSINLSDKEGIEELKDIQYLKIGERLNEQLFKKQKFYTKKLC